MCSTAVLAVAISMLKSLKTFCECVNKNLLRMSVDFYDNYSHIYVIEQASTLAPVGRAFKNKVFFFHDSNWRL